MKDRGIREIRSATRRVIVLRSLERISEEDAKVIEAALNRAENRIMNMTEYDATGQEVIDG